MKIFIKIIFEILGFVLNFLNCKYQFTFDNKKYLIIKSNHYCVHDPSIKLEIRGDIGI